MKERTIISRRKGYGTALVLAFFVGHAVLAGHVLSMADPALEEGKALFENAQYMAALGKFMTVLRRDSQQPEARRYLRLVVDMMRQNPSGAPGKRSLGSGLSSMAAQEELRDLMRRRSLLTLDLKAIPGVQLHFKGGVAQVEIETPMLFAENTGGLREQGIPVLDRVSAWLKTFGQQPIIVHCYPEEFQEPSDEGSLFLKRYSELYSFFVEERKIPAQRFVSAEFLSDGPDDKVKSSKKDRMPAAAADPALIPAVDERARMNPRVVIETIGTQTEALETALPAAIPRHALSRWLELSVETSRKIFNPEEGEWASMDIAALTRTGLRSWRFYIVPEGGDRAVMSLEGNGNLLKRISWDGHDDKSGSFVAPGSYVAKLTATDSDGTIQHKSITLQVHRGGMEAPAALKPAKTETKPASPKIASKPKPAKAAKRTKKKAAPPPPSPVEPQPEEPLLQPESTLMEEQVVSKSKRAAPKPTPKNAPAPVPKKPPVVAAVPKPAPAPVPPVHKKADRPAAVLEDEDEDSLISDRPAEPAKPPKAAPAPTPPPAERDEPEPAPVEPAANEAAEEADAIQAIWKQVIQFEAGRSELKPTVKASLERIGKTLEVYPLQKVRILGYAGSGEKDAADLAKKRAAVVRSILVDQYHVDKKRVIVTGGKVASGNASKVEMSITN